MQSDRSSQYMNLDVLKQFPESSTIQDSSEDKIDKGSLKEKQTSVLKPHLEYLFFKQPYPQTNNLKRKIRGKSGGIQNES